MVNSSDENEAVFCPATLKLGELHWYILHASHLMYDKAIVEIKLSDTKLSAIRGSTSLQVRANDFNDVLGGFSGGLGTPRHVSANMVLHQLGH